jgi:cytochrome c2
MAQPFYSWAPCIGVSSLMVAHGQRFKLWERDLLVTWLKDRAIYRARVRDARVVMMERISVGRRIRDIAEGANGELLLLTDQSALLHIEVDTDVGRGETLFGACSGCHVIEDGRSHIVGPDLRKVVDRPIATAVGARYSPALKKLGGTWTRSAGRVSQKPASLCPRHGYDLSGTGRCRGPPPIDPIPGERLEQPAAPRGVSD